MHDFCRFYPVFIEQRKRSKQIISKSGWGFIKRNEDKKHCAKGFTQGDSHSKFSLKQFSWCNNQVNERTMRSRSKLL